MIIDAINGDYDKNNKMSEGVTGLSELAESENRVSKEIWHKRLEICNRCQYNSGTNCTRCGCLIRAKTLNKNHECPIGLWKTEK